MRSLYALPLILSLATPAVAQDASADTVVARVGDTEITLGHMAALYASLPAEQRQLPPEMLWDGVLERLVQQEAVAQAAGTPSPFMELQLENERRSLLASSHVEKLAEGVEVTDEEIQAAYDARFAGFEPEKEYNASHILVETEEEAAALIEELNGGADFAELAREHSTGPSGPGGGELGWFGLGRMVPEFEAAVVGLEVGEVSAPVQTQFGWHVVKLNDSRVPEAPALDEVRGELEQELWREELNAAITAVIDEAEIERLDVSGIDRNLLVAPEITGDD